MSEVVRPCAEYDRADLVAVLHCGHQSRNRASAGIRGAVARADELAGVRQNRLADEGDARGKSLRRSSDRASGGEFEFGDFWTEAGRTHYGVHEARSDREIGGICRCRSLPSPFFPPVSTRFKGCGA